MGLIDPSPTLIRENCARIQYFDEFLYIHFEVLGIIKSIGFEITAVKLAWY